MVQNYYKFAPAGVSNQKQHLEGTIGMVASPHVNQLFYDKTSTNARNVFTAGLDHVLIWNMKQNALQQVLHVNIDNDNKYQPIDYSKYGNITCMTMSNDGSRVAVGYMSGRVIIYKRGTRKNDEWIVELNSIGHSTTVSALCFNDTNTLLASGGDDSDIVLWDVVASTALYRMRGHKSRVTSLLFFNNTRSPLLVSGSKDMLIKLWELDTQHCIQTLIGSRTEIWSLAKTNDERRLIAGSTTNELRVWDMEPLLKQEDNNVPMYQVDPVYLGTFLKADEERVIGMKFDPTGQILAIYSDSKKLELFRIRPKKEFEQKFRQRFAERNKKNKEKKFDEEEDEVQDDNSAELELTNKLKVTVEFARLHEIELDQNVRAVDFDPAYPFEQTDKGKFDTIIRIGASTLRNSIIEYDVQLGEEIKHKVATRVEKHGHGTPVRSLSMSSDGKLILSTSSKQARIWSIATFMNRQDSTECIRVMDSNYGLSSLFAPGDKHVIVGTKKGHLEIFDISSGLKLEDIADAHSGAVWSMCMKPDKSGIITASADCCVKFWDFILNDKKQLSLSLEHTLKMNEDVVSVTCSPQGKFLAVSLLDSTVKVFYLDSLKFFLSLYGHKLPVNSLSISSDETIIATASADKNVKIWGLDFGDCHKSIFAHESSISQIAFVPDTHYFFTAGKDGALKYWDADTHDCIQIIRPAHLHSPLWSLALATDNEDYVRVITAGHERAIFSYEQTSELIFIEEEEEKRQEEEYEKDLANSQQFVNIADPTKESTHAGKRTIETIRDGEKLIEALKVAMEQESLTPEEQAAPNPLLLGLSVDEYVWRYLTKIAPSELDLVMAILPYSYALYVLTKLDKLLKTTETAHVEYASRIILILVQIHQKTILLDHKIFPLIHSLSSCMKTGLQQEKNTIGFNLAALQFVKNHIRSEMEFRLWNDQVVNHVSDLKNQQRVLSYREKQKEQAKLAKKETEKGTKKKPKKGRFQGMLDNLIRKEDEEKLEEDQPLTFEVKESAWKEKQKKRKREETEMKNKRLKMITNNNDDGDEEMQQLLSGM